MTSMQRTNPLGIPWLNIDGREHGCGRLPRRRSRITATDTIGGCRRSGSFPFCSGAGLRAKTFAAERQYNAIRRLNRYSCALCKSAMLQYPSREINCKDHRRADCITEPLQVVESDRIGIAQKSRGAPIERSTDRIFSGPRTPPLNSGKLLWLNALPLLRS
jgi:hypothetical protein